MPTEISRRLLLEFLGVSAIGPALPAHTALSEEPLAHGQGSPSPAAGLTALNRFPRMAQEYFVAQVRDCEQKRLHRLAELKTTADAEAYVRELREKMHRVFGPPPEKTPLNARVHI